MATHCGGTQDSTARNIPIANQSIVPGSQLTATGPSAAT